MKSLHDTVASLSAVDQTVELDEEEETKAAVSVICHSLIFINISVSRNLLVLCVLFAM